MGRVLRIRTRQGAEIPFDEKRIAGDIFHAAQASGQEDRALADELASVVTLFLERRFEERVPDVDEIQDMVEKVLLETGHAQAAKTYILQREAKTRLREGRASPPAEAPLFPEGAVVVDSPSRGTAQAWNRGRIAAALVTEGRVDPRVAEEVAANVELRIFSSGAARVSTRLVRELADAELFARGIGRPLAEQAVVGLPRYDLRELLSSGAAASPGPDAVGRAVESAVLGQYALEEVFSPEVSRAHAEGVLHLHGVGDPLRPHALHVSPLHVARHGLRLPGAGAVAPPPASVRDLLEALPPFVGAARALVSGALDLGDPAPALAPFAPAEPEALADEAQRLWRALAGVAGVPPRAGPELSVNLAPPEAGGGSPRAAALGAALAEAYARLAEGPLARGLPRLTLHVDEETFRSEPLRATLRSVARVARLAREGPAVTFAFAREGAGWSLRDRTLSRVRDPAVLRAPGGPRVTVLQAVTLNLPRAALEGGRMNLDGFLGEVERAVALALGAARERRGFLKRMASGAGSPLASAVEDSGDGRPLLDLDRSHVLLGVAGLAEAVTLLCGPARREDAWIRTEARVAGFVHYRAAEEARRHGFGLEFLDEVPPAVRARLRSLDVERFPGAVPDGPYGQGLVLEGTDPAPLLAAIRRRASLHALVEPRVTISGLPAKPDPGLIYDLISEVHENTQVAFLRFA